MYPHPFAVDIADLEVQGFAQAQAHAINGEDIGLVAQLPGGVDDPLDLRRGEDIRQWFVLGWLDDGHPLPILIEHVLVEELQPVAIHLDRAPGVTFHQGVKALLELCQG